ncbi:MAG TPA: hypothetical protein VGR74_15735 [Actinomycetota bacterium]|nr:hypothetical protein [Actinomycetota bacterium]
MTAQHDSRDLSQYDAVARSRFDALLAGLERVREFSLVATFLDTST